jgi:hypothetical protein
MPFHFCSDELFMLMSALPFIGFAAKNLHTWYHVKFKHKCHEKTCDKEHLDHDKV